MGRITVLLSHYLLTQTVSAFTPIGGVSTSRASTGFVIGNTRTESAPALISSSCRTNTKLAPLSALPSFFQNQVKKEPEPVILPGVGPEGCALESPSKVNTLDTPIQAVIFASILTSLALLTVPFSTFLSDVTMQYEWVQSWRYSWPLGLGVIYTAAGVTHFTVSQEYENIYPTKGAWGLWYLPGSPEFHVKWTGVAEILGGVGLLIGGLYDAFAPVYATCPNVFTSAGIGSDAAAGLLVLTAVVTPANIFMYTHGAKLPMDGPEVPVVGHFVRGLMQVFLFGLLYQMGVGTFDELLG